MRRNGHLEGTPAAAASATAATTAATASKTAAVAAASSTAGRGGNRFVAEKIVQGRRARRHSGSDRLRPEILHDKRPVVIDEQADMIRGINTGDQTLTEKVANLG